MDAQAIRERFTDFFVRHDHRRMAGAPLVAPGDPTLLFTSAGMVPFKPYFLGQEAAPHPRLTSIQKCFRTTDIDAVGDDSHLTFFEMMGNFAIGDYFKAEAQAWAWDLLTKDLGIPADRLVTTVHPDDEEADENWRKLGLPEQRIFRDPGNYWYAGEDGPCGPDSEIYYDLRPEPGGAHPGPVADETRYLEIWNLVFTQFQRHPDGSKTPLPTKNIDTGAGLERWAVMLQGKDSIYETDLFAPLLRYAAGRCDLAYSGATPAQRRALRVIVEHGRAITFLIADGVLPSNEGRGYVLRRLLRRALYMAHTLGIEEPLLADLAAEVRGAMGAAYPGLIDQAALIDQILAQEEERFRQTLATGRTLLEEQTIPLKRAFHAISEPFRSQIEKLLDEAMRPVAEEVSRMPSEGRIGQTMADVIRPVAEEMRSTASEWRHLLRDALSAQSVHNRALADLTHAAAEQPLQPLLGERESLLADRIADAIAEQERATASITGAEAFLLYDTYGFPAELTHEVATLAGLAFDEAGFRGEMERQQARGRAAGEFRQGAEARVYAEVGGRSEFIGHHSTAGRGIVLALVQAGTREEAAEAGATVEVILDRTPFYPEGGGQVGDAGRLLAPGGEIAVGDTQARGDLISHTGEVVAGRVAVGDAVEATVDVARRRAVQGNHTATHLLHAALRHVLGDHVRQSGSLVAPDRLRFDYTQPQAPTREQLAEVQRLINARISDDIAVHAHELPYDDALQAGAIAIFGEKYGTHVRIVEVCDPDPAVRECFSKELCGGTHVPVTGAIGGFEIISEGSVGAGLRRIEALTGPAAEAWRAERLHALSEAAALLKAPPTELPERVRALQRELSAARARLAGIERQAGASAAARLLSAATTVDGIALVAGRVEVASADALRETGDAVREQLGSGVIVLGAITKGRPAFVAMVTPDLVAAGLHAGRLIKAIATIAGGGGGGRPEMAQAGGRDAARLDEALAAAPEIVRGQRAS